MPLLSEAKNRKQRRVIIFFMVKTGLNNLTPLEKVKLAEHVVEKMTGNPNFTTPIPTLVSVSAAATALFDAENAMDGSKNKTSVRNTAEKALVKKMRQLQSYVDTIADGDTDVITSSGMDVRDARTPSTILEPPVGLQASATFIEGEVKLKFKSIRKKVLYIVEAAQDEVIPNYELVAESTKATIIIKNLNPGQKYRFRVAVINTAGQSGWSEEVICRPLQN
jgi:hypothetical protein